MLHLCPESPFTSLDSYIKITDEGTDLVQYAAAFTFDPRCKQILLILEHPIPDVSIYAQGDLLTAVSTGSTIVYVPIQAKITPFPCINTLTFEVPALQSQGNPRPCLHAWLLQKDSIFFHEPEFHMDVNPLGEITWDLQIQGRIDNTRSVPVCITLQALLSFSQEPVISREMPALSLSANTHTVFQHHLTISAPHLWTPETPSVYIVTLFLMVEGEIMDVLSCPLAFRDISQTDGGALLLNQSPWGPRGFCIPDVSCYHPAFIEYQLQLIKNIGANAVTTNTPADASFYQSCLSLGLLYEPALSFSLPLLKFSLFPESTFLSSYQAQWTDVPMLAFGTHWNLPVDSGSIVPVPIYSNCEEVEILLNDRSVGRYPLSNGGCLAKVPYEMGRLEGVGYRNGREEAHAQIVTTGLADSLQMYLSKTYLVYGRQDAVVACVRTVDFAGHPVPDADQLIFFEGRSGVQVYQTGSLDDGASPRFTPYHPLYNGECYAILESTDGDDALINVYTQELTGDSAILPVREIRSPDIAPGCGV
jgi:glycosyl hydrolases family 2, immunoglobulin-like beta-sandwich domain